LPFSLFTSDTVCVFVAAHPSCRFASYQVWWRLPFDNDLQPVYQSDRFYIYYRALEGQWVVDGAVEPEVRYTLLGFPVRGTDSAVVPVCGTESSFDEPGTSTIGPRGTVGHRRRRRAGGAS
jgi:hypothetical protein